MPELVEKSTCPGTHAQRILFESEPMWPLNMDPFMAVGVAVRANHNMSVPSGTSPILVLVYLPRSCHGNAIIDAMAVGHGLLSIWKSEVCCWCSLL